MKYEFYSDHSFKEDMLEACMRQLLIGFSRQLQNAEQPVPVSREEEQKLWALRMKVLSQPERHWTVAQMAELAPMFDWARKNGYTPYGEVYATMQATYCDDEGNTRRIHTFYLPVYEKKITGIP